MDNQKQLYSGTSAEKEKPSMQPERRRKVMIALWAKMRQFFGNAWVSTYGTIDDQTIYGWTGALNQFTEAELAGAIKACEDWPGKFAPNFPEFKTMCMAARANLKSVEISHRVMNETKSLEDLTGHKRGETEIARREKEKQRKILGLRPLVTNVS